LIYSSNRVSSESCPYIGVYYESLKQLEEWNRYNKTMKMISISASSSKITPEENWI